MHLPFHPQLLLRRFHKEHRCFPHLRSAKQGKPVKDAARTLAESVRQLLTQDAAGRAALQPALSGDVRESVQAILRLIEALTADAAAGAPGHRSELLEAAVQLVEDLVAADLPMTLLQALPHFDFETRKDIMNMSCALLRSGLPAEIDHFVVGYFREHPQVFSLVVEGYGDVEVALQYGVVLRSCARHRELVAAFFESGLILELVRLTRHPSLDISTDAFASLREMLLEHKDVGAAWLLEHGDEFFGPFNELLRAEAYVVQRQALKLLTEMLRDPRFRKVMWTYVNDEGNLKITMNLLRDQSKAIQLDAFQLLVLFAANPEKTNKVHQILYKNREKLISLILSLSPAKPDPSFTKEQQLVVERLRPLGSPASSPRPTASGAASLGSASPTTSTVSSL